MTRLLNRSFPWTCPDCGTSFNPTSEAEAGFTFGGNGATCQACGYVTTEDEFADIYAKGHKKSPFCIAMREFDIELPKLAIPRQVKERLTRFPQFKRKRYWSSFGLYDLAWLIQSGQVDRNDLPLLLLPVEVFKFLSENGVCFSLFPWAFAAVKGGVVEYVKLAVALKSEDVTLPEALLCEKMLSSGNPSVWRRILQLDEGGGAADGIINGLIRRIVGFRERYPNRVNRMLAEFSPVAKFLVNAFVPSNMLAGVEADISFRPDIGLEAFDATVSPYSRRKMLPFLLIEDLVERLCHGRLKLPIGEFPFDRLSDRGCLELIAEDRPEWRKELPNEVYVRAETELASMSVSDLIETVKAHHGLLVRQSVVDALPLSTLIGFLAEGAFPEDRIDFPFERLEQKHWKWYFDSCVIAFSKKTRAAFSKQVSAKCFSIKTIQEIIASHQQVAELLPVDDLEIGEYVSLLLRTNSAVLWQHQRLKELNAKEWLQIVLGREKLVQRRYLNYLRNSEGMDTDTVVQILKHDQRYVEFLPLDLIPKSMVVDCLIGGEYESLWEAYSFAAFGKREWLRLLMHSDHPIPDAGKLFLRDEERQVEDDKLNALIANRPELAVYVDANRIDTRVAIKLLLSDKGSSLWRWFDFSRFSKDEIEEIIAKVEFKPTWPDYVRDLFRLENGLFTDLDVLRLANAQPVVVTLLIAFDRLAKFTPEQFGEMVRIIAESEEARKVFLSRLGKKSKGWRTLDEERAVILLTAMPECRGYLDWCNFSFRKVRRLQRADIAFKREFPFPQKIWFFLWRWWFIVVPLLVIVAHLAYGAYLEAQERMKRMEEEARRTVFVERINKLYREREYDDLAFFIERVRDKSYGALTDPRTEEARENLRVWQQKKKENLDRLGQLEALCGAGWNAENEETGLRILEKLELCDTFTVEERVRLEVLKKGCEAWLPIKATKKRNGKTRETLQKLQAHVNDTEDAKVLKKIVERVLEVKNRKDSDEDTRALCQTVADSVTRRIEGLVAKEIHSDDLEKMVLEITENNDSKQKETETTGAPNKGTGNVVTPRVKTESKKDAKWTKCPKCKDGVTENGGKCSRCKGVGYTWENDKSFIGNLLDALF